MAEKPNILIAMPAYGGGPHWGCHDSVTRLMFELKARSIDCYQKSLALPNIYLMRNLFASFFVQETQHTHMLFQDSDIVARPQSTIRMLEADKDVVGCVCPLRNLDLAAALNHARDGLDNAAAIAKASQFNVRIERLMTDANGLAPLNGSFDGIGTGLMLIKRSALQGMIDSGNLRKHFPHEYGPFGLNGPLYGFFDPVFRDGAAQGEDYSFCARYRELTPRPSIYAMINEDIIHIGEFMFRASILHA